MARNLPSLVALRAFEAAARHLSFTAAAEELNVTQGAISRHIKSLEDALKLRLFRRLPRTLELTPEGQAYYPALRDALDTIERATRRLCSKSEDNVLTLSVLPTIAMSWIIPRLYAFNALHPEIEIRISTSILPADFRAEIDMALRTGQPPRLQKRRGKGAYAGLAMAESWTGIEAEYLMPVIVVPVCSPALVAGEPPLRRPADLKNHVLVHTATRPNAWIEWLRAVGQTGIDSLNGPRYAHFFQSIHAAMRGEGIACVPRVHVADDIASGRLVVPFDHPVESAGAYYLLYRKHDAEQPKIRAFRDWLLKEAVTYR